MTTLLYSKNEGVIAYDSRSTRDNVIISDSVDKLVVRDGVKFVLCGAVCDHELLIDMYFGAESKLIPECNAFVISLGEVLRIGVNDEGILWRQPVTHNDAMGSGGYWALSAMDFGLDAVKAVEYAAKRDCYTGGEIRTVSVR